MLWKTLAGIGQARLPFLFPGERGHYNTAVPTRKEMRVTSTKSLLVNEIGAKHASLHRG